MSDYGQRDASAGTLLLDLHEHRDDLGVRPFVFRHRLADDPRFARDDLGDLIARLPCAWVLAHEAQHDPQECRGKDALAAEADLGAVVRELPTSHASIRAYNLEHTTPFRPLYAEAEQAVRDFVGDHEGGVEEVNLATFVASAGAVTAAHPDRHHNLLLHVDGQKEVWVDDDPDRRGHHARTLDYFRAPHLGAPELPPAASFVLSPGEGVYIPPYAWHWTEVLGDDSSAGFSIGFSTPITVQNARVVAIDMKLRRFGVRPRPPDPSASSLVGRMKLGLEPVAAVADRVRRARGERLIASRDSQEVAG
jgi:quercetin dioxygenase-like cupin family protein